MPTTTTGDDLEGDQATGKWRRLQVAEQGTPQHKGGDACKCLWISLQVYADKGEDFP